MTRMIRGMVPHTRPKGDSAMKRLRVYIGVPKSYEGTAMKQFEDAKIRKPTSYYLSVRELAKAIGWNE
jgi:large subunit ribosomal protein L13